MDLSQIKLVTEYEIVGIDLEEASIRHLADLGIKIGSFIQVISKTNDTAISLSSSCEDCTWIILF